jgi:ribulose-5-phosphate 4-epimerase/fuculose-1-phosphate aldolase
VAEGDLDGMSTEVVAMHALVYRARPQASAVIHTHSPHLVAFAPADRSLPAGIALACQPSRIAGYSVSAPSRRVVV